MLKNFTVFLFAFSIFFTECLFSKPPCFDERHQTLTQHRRVIGLYYAKKAPSSHLSQKTRKFASLQKKASPFSPDRFATPFMQQKRPASYPDENKFYDTHLQAPRTFTNKFSFLHILILWLTTFNCISGNYVARPYQGKVIPINQVISIERRTELFQELEVAYYQGEICDTGMSEAFQSLGLNAVDFAPQNIRPSLPKGTSAKTEFCKNQNQQFLSPKDLPSMEFDSSHMQVVRQFNYVVANQNELQFLATGNLMRCVGIALFNPDFGIGGLAHAAGEQIKEIDSYLQSANEKTLQLAHFMKQVAKETDPRRLKVTLVSGSKAHLLYFKRLFMAHGVEEFMIVQDDEWIIDDNNSFKKNRKRGSLILNISSGNVYIASNESLTSLETEVGVSLSMDRGFPLIEKPAKRLNLKDEL